MMPYFTVKCITHRKEPIMITPQEADRALDILSARYSPALSPAEASIGLRYGVEII